MTDASPISNITAGVIHRSISPDAESLSSIQKKTFSSQQSRSRSNLKKTDLYQKQRRVSQDDIHSNSNQQPVIILQHQTANSTEP
jgi:hypothetical protein